MKEKEFEQMLHKVCMKMMELEDAQIKEEMKNAEQHIFSKEFEEKMKILLDSKGRSKRSNQSEAE